MSGEKLHSRRHSDALTCTCITKGCLFFSFPWSFFSSSKGRRREKLYKPVCVHLRSTVSFFLITCLWVHQNQWRESGCSVLWDALKACVCVCVCVYQGTWYQVREAEVKRVSLLNTIIDSRSQSPSPSVLLHWKSKGDLISSDVCYK